MAITLAQLMNGIKQAESSGRYNIVNPIGAVGAYQIMKANIPEWTKQALGHSMTWQQFRDSPSAQDKVAEFKIGGFFKKYGAEGAAAMWLSGQPDPNHVASDGSITVRQYVDKVIKLGGGTPSKNTTSAGVPGMAAMTPDETAESYGFVQGLFNSNPELKKLFDQAVKGQWTAQKFQASLRDTKWFKTHSQTERDFITLQFGDPATANQKLKQARDQAITAAAAMGIKISPAINNQITAAAYNIAAKGWTDGELKNYLGQYVVFKPGAHPGGQAGQDLDTLQQFSYQMGIKNSDSWYQTQLQNIERGASTLEDAQQALRKQAQTLFPTWSKQIEGGQTVQDLASPYMQSMATILEVNPGSLNLFDPTIKKALQYKDPKTGANTAQPIWSFENTLRNDARWKQTKNAQDSVMQNAHQVLSDFGLVF